MGLGFTCALTIIGAVRELIGAGEVFGAALMPESYVPCSIFVLAPGAFFVLAVLTAIQNKVKIAGEKKGRDMSKIQSGCNSDCMNCGESGCSKRFFGESTKEKEEDLEIIEITEEKDFPDAGETAEKEENTETEKAAERREEEIND